MTVTKIKPPSSKPIGVPFLTDTIISDGFLA